MIDLLDLHKSFLKPHLFPGAHVCDFTMGNGHDTLWLCKEVGESGKVWAFDIQQQAIDSTSAFLASNLPYKNYELVHDSHANASNYVEGKINAGVFNLGYLPGGDKSITTMRTSTLPAVAGAIEMLGDNGIILVAVYPGHEEGSLEGKELDAMLRQYSRFKCCVSRFEIINSPTSPFFFMIETK